MISWRPRRFFVPSLVTFCLVVCILILSLVSDVDRTSEMELMYKVAELQNRLKHAEMVNRERKEDVLDLSERLHRLASSNGGGSKPQLEDDLSPDARALDGASGTRRVGNVTHRLGRGALSSGANGNNNNGNGANSVNVDGKTRAKVVPAGYRDDDGYDDGIGGGGGGSLLSSDVSVPNIYHYLPHLLNYPDALAPSFKLSKDRPRVSVVLGIPTVKRQVQSYLLGTLENLIENMKDKEREDTLIVVFAGETDGYFVQSVAKDITKKFPEHVESGLIEVIAPSQHFYPNLTAIPASLGDTPDRTRWRTKQNLDFAYLMMYCRNRGTYYVQLEDDILSKPSFISTMKAYASQKTSEKANWIILDFCQLGFIGKMFRTVQLPSLIHFLLMFYADKPSDWLLDNMIQTKVCRFDQTAKHCKKNKDAVWIHHKPSLFQHVGTHSSLAGKVQKLKDKGFGKVLLHKPHKNPSAAVTSDLKEYHNFKLARAYAGETYFWGLLPQPGDALTFSFQPPVRIARYLLRSGNNEHPLDRFYNTSVEALPVDPPDSAVAKKFQVLPDGFYVVGRFNDEGLAEGNQTAVFGSIKKMRMTVHAESDKWAILSEILFEEPS